MMASKLLFVLPMPKAVLLTSTATTITVSSVPSAGITSGYAADTICEGEYPIFTATPADPTLTYSFYNG